MGEQVLDTTPVHPTNELEEILDLGNGFKLTLLKRAAWGAELPLNTTENTWPVSNVRLTSTNCDKCFNTDDCKNTVRRLQRSQMTYGHDDIQHNFIIGGDQKLYEGRGFSWAPLLPKEYSHLNGKCIDIAFAGSYESSELPYHMMMIALDLIKYCIKKRIVDPRFELIPLAEAKPKNESIE